MVLSFQKAENGGKSYLLPYFPEKQWVQYVLCELLRHRTLQILTYNKLKVKHYFVLHCSLVILAIFASQQVNSLYDIQYPL